MVDKIMENTLRGGMIKPMHSEFQINSLYQAVFELIDDKNKHILQTKWNCIIGILVDFSFLEIESQYGNNVENIIKNYNLYYYKYYNYLKILIKGNKLALIKGFDKWIADNNVNLNNGITTEIFEIVKLQNILPINKSIITPIVKSSEDYMGNNRFLDCFARLITGDEVCTSVAYADNTIFISSNNSIPVYAKIFNNLLVTYSNDAYSIGALYSKVMYNAVKSLESYLLRNITLYDEVIFLNADDSFCKLLYLFIKSFSSEVLSKERLFELFDEALKYFINIKDSLITNDLVYNSSLILSRVKIDIDFVVKFIGNNKFTPIVESLRANNIYYICDESIDNSYIHSEMKIAQYFFNNTIKKAYIGSSMLSCALCHLALTSLTAHSFSFDYCGTHGYAYSDWEVPKMFLESCALKSTFKNNVINYNNTVEVMNIDNFEMRIIA